MNIRVPTLIAIALTLNVGCSTSDSSGDGASSGEAGKDGTSGSSGSAGEANEDAGSAGRTTTDGKGGRSEQTGSGGKVGRGGSDDAGATSTDGDAGTTSTAGRGSGGTTGRPFGGASSSGGVTGRGGRTSGGATTTSGGAAQAGSDDGGTTSAEGGADNESGGAAGSAGSAGSAECSDPSSCNKPLATGLALTKISLYQSVEIPLMKDGEELLAPRNSPIVRDKDALVRLFVTLGDGFDSRPLEAVLQVTNAAGTTTLTAKKSPTTDSTDAELTSTFNLTVPGSLLTEDAVYRAWLSDPDGTAGAKNPDALFPPTEPAALGVEPAAGIINLIITRGRYNPDGSGRLPDVSEEKLEQIRAEFLKLYPIAAQDLTITVSDTIIDVPEPLLCDRSGWDMLFELTYGLSDYIDGNYQYLMVAPAETDEEYFHSVPEEEGCITGVGSTPWEVGGIAFPLATGLSNPATVAHEIGHNHGRMHTDCGGVDDLIDTAYPYAGGSIGVWGYDGATETLYDPSTYADFMSYCDDIWVSDYTYQGLYDWMEKTATRYSVIGAPTNWQALHVTGSGVAVPLGTMRTPAGASPDVELSWLGPSGTVLSTTKGFVMRSAPLPDLWVLTTALPTGATALAIENGPTVPLL